MKKLTGPYFPAPAPMPTSGILSVSPQESRPEGYAMENVKSLLHLSGELNKFITGQKLAVPVQGRLYVQVEGWQFAGAMLGLTCYPLGVEDLSNDSEIRFRASAEVVRLADGKRVSRASMSCSNRERGKGGFEPYAVESMAQTRAVSKAYRIFLSWLIKAAGFEATPYEEMSFVEHEQDQQPATIMAGEAALEELFALCNSPFIYPGDFDEPAKARIKGRDLTDTEARAHILRLQDLIAERNY